MLLNTWFTPIPKASKVYWFPTSCATHICPHPSDSSPTWLTYIYCREIFKTYSKRTWPGISRDTNFCLGGWLNGSVPDCDAEVLGLNVLFPSPQQTVSVPREVATWDGTVPCAGLWEVLIYKIRHKNLQKYTGIFAVCAHPKQSSGAVSSFKNNLLQAFWRKKRAETSQIIFWSF